MRIALGIEYNGEMYCGWQRQKHSPSVQENLDSVLSTIANQPIKSFCAGRTDTGVHATGQVIHFDLETPRPETAWLRGANNYLPHDISVRWVREVSEDFHARFSATSRSYRYVIYNSETPSAIYNRRTTWHRLPIDIIKMQKGADHLVGKYDFNAFRASGCQANTSIRDISKIEINRSGAIVTIDITANAFLHHMVRNIVGCLLLVGTGKKDASFVASIRDGKDRTKAPDTAKSDGLYLVGVGYPREFELPQTGELPFR